MKELMPPLARAGVLLNPDNPAMPSILRAMTQTAKAINVTLQSIDVRDLNELEPAIRRAKSQFDSIVVSEDGFFIANRTRIAELAIGIHRDHDPAVADFSGSHLNRRLGCAGRCLLPQRS